MSNMCSDMCTMEDIGMEMAKRYENYREYAELLSHYIMSTIVGWQVYITENDIDIFRLNFVSDTDGVENYVFLVRKEQLCGMDYLLKSVIIPELNCRDKKAGVE